MPAALSESRLSTLVLFLFVAIGTLGCTTDQQDNDLSGESITIEDPQSPALGVERTGPIGREVSRVEIPSGKPAVQLGKDTSVFRVDVMDARGAEVGSLSTCFPAEFCGSDRFAEEGDCVRLDAGGEDCLISGSSGSQHVIHVLRGPVSIAEAIAAADLADAATPDSG